MSLDLNLSFGTHHHDRLADDVDLNTSAERCLVSRTWGVGKLKASTLFIITVLSVILNAALMIPLPSRLREFQRSPLEACQVVYTPAQDVLQYKPIKWDPLPGERLSIFDQEPSEDLDVAWEGLYKNAISKVTEAQAELLSNETRPIEDDEGYYYTALEVFHELHCLDRIRKAVDPEYYPPEFPDDPQQTRGHISHCLSAIRQSLMCSADITPSVWQWSEEAGVAMHRVDLPHSCRNFDAIQDWAEQNRVTHDVDVPHHV